MGIQDIKKDFQRDEALVALVGTLYKFYGGNVKDKRNTQFTNSSSNKRGTQRGTSRGTTRGVKRGQ